MRKEKPVQITNLAGGLREDLTDAEIKPSQWRRLYNMMYDYDGTLISRTGTSKYNATAITGATSIDNMFRFYRSGANTLVVSINHATNNKIYKGDDSAGTFAKITGGTGLTANLPINFITAKDNTLLLSNGTQTIQSFTTGTTKADLVFSDNNRKGKFLAIADERLHVAGDPNAPNTMYMSVQGIWSTAPGTDCSFPTNNNVVIPRDDNDY